jgi:hypothetical protein
MSSMVPTLSDLCKRFIFKYGIGPRSQLPEALSAEISGMDTTVNLDISGCYYSRITAHGSAWSNTLYNRNWSETRGLDIDVEWYSGEWRFAMRYPRGRRYETRIRAGGRTSLGNEWNTVFLLRPFSDDDIVIYDFVIQLDQRTVCFYGQKYMKGSRQGYAFKTTFSFSVTSHYMRIDKEYTDALPDYGWEMYESPSTYMFFSQPDTRDGAFDRYLD